MKYFKIVYDYNKSDNWIFLNIDENELPFERYDVYESKPLRIERIYCTVEEEQVEFSDYLANNLGYLIVSEKVKSIFERFHMCKCEFIEVVEKHSGDKMGYLVNCLEHFEALDMEKSKLQMFPENPLMPFIILRYAILEDKIQDKDFFQLQEQIFPYFISEGLKSEMVKNKVIGFDFERVISP